MDADSGLPDSGGPHATVHRYVSTYCQHGLCQENVCRLRCKICAAPCLCPCHAPALQAGR